MVLIANTLTNDRLLIRKTFSDTHHIPTIAWCLWSISTSFRALTSLWMKRFAALPFFWKKKVTSSPKQKSSPAQVAESTKLQGRGLGGWLWREPRVSHERCA
jgi:hypothetical protein